MKLVIAATPAVAIPSINALRDSHEVTLVTQPDAPAGRGKRVRPTPVGEAYPEVEKPESESALAKLLEGSDLLITIGYGRLLSESTLSIPKFGGINLHFSLLPRWRGAAPVQRAIEAGDRISGVTVFQMDKGMDTGPIWSQLPFEIPYGFTSNDLFEALSNLGVKALLTAIEMISAGQVPKAQEGTPTIAKKISKSESEINWNDSTESILRKIRAFGGYSQIRGEILKIESAISAERVVNPGHLISGGYVGTADGALQLLRVRPAGKRSMTASDWLNGFKITSGEHFGS